MNAWRARLVSILITIAAAVAVLGFVPPAAAAAPGLDAFPTDGSRFRIVDIGGGCLRDRTMDVISVKCDMVDAAQEWVYDPISQQLKRGSMCLKLAAAKRAISLEGCGISSGAGDRK
ncbi:hypothetical protein [Glycomyces dulcitolivorans]|uniref:hypothetical protein n=1 Tax=Glycomyces dulcitolivorans TaxID=2200759 RepID=UPI000DD2FC96|nr:hypothetical protein [Glycomyces dulcitolivorans]